MKPGSHTQAIDLPESHASAIEPKGMAVVFEMPLEKLDGQAAECSPGVEPKVSSSMYSQVPWPEHWPGQGGASEQSSPVQPASQMHLPFQHSPWPEQPLSHAATSQYGPLHP